VVQHVGVGEVGRREVEVAVGGEQAQRLVVLGTLRQVAGDVDEAGEGADRVLPPLPVLVGLVVLG